MSSDQRPARMRVVSGAQVPARRRGDQPGDLDAGLAGALPARQAPSTAVLLALFLIGCVAGGALLMLSGVIDLAAL